MFKEYFIAVATDFKECSAADRMATAGKGDTEAKAI